MDWPGVVNLVDFWLSLGLFIAVCAFYIYLYINIA